MADTLHSIVVRYVGWRTLVSLFPVSVLFLLLAWFDQSALGKVPVWIHFLLWTAWSSWLAARFAVGSLEQGRYASLWERVDWKRVHAVALRHVALSLLWSVPASLLVLWSDPVGAVDKFKSQFLWHKLFGRHLDLPLFEAWVLVTAVAAAFLLPPLTILVAASARSWRELVQAGFWKRLITEQWRDILLVLVLSLGGALVAGLLYLPILSGAALVAWHVSQSLAKAIAGASILLPWLGWSILNGMLAGRFARQVHGTESVS